MSHAQPTEIHSLGGGRVGPPQEAAETGVMSSLFNYLQSGEISGAGGVQ